MFLSPTTGTLLVLGGPLRKTHSVLHLTRNFLTHLKSIITPSVFSHLRVCTYLLTLTQVTARQVLSPVFDPSLTSPSPPLIMTRAFHSRLDLPVVPSDLTNFILYRTGTFFFTVWTMTHFHDVSGGLTKNSLGLTPIQDSWFILDCR